MEPQVLSMEDIEKYEETYELSDFERNLIATVRAKEAEIAELHEDLRIAQQHESRWRGMWNGLRVFARSHVRKLRRERETLQTAYNEAVAVIEFYADESWYEFNGIDVSALVEKGAIARNFLAKHKEAREE